MTKTFQVEPQRSDGRCYVPCELHQATSFAVVQIETWTKKLNGKSKRFKSRRVITRKPTHNSAKLEAEAMARRSVPLDLYRLGKRIIKKEPA